ncbi:hypothetical protein VNI00_017473 [Paramarasmius palmivorus]|uniref:Nephrocystin 3-like N-terminal domain-containing protein n=1 Tax=Paramarasmius palmivorus TaxID=297713 RepID=A0AAW0B5H9_9AGAR
MSFFRDGSSFHIYDSQYNNAGPGNYVKEDIGECNIPSQIHILKIHKGLPDTLLYHLAPNAFYDAKQRFPYPNCRPGTRTAVLEELDQWIYERSKERGVCWVHGPVGVGKSAIAQNLSEAYANERLAASFFFSPNDSTRNNPGSFVATIVYQLVTSPHFKDTLGTSILEVIRSRPSIFQDFLELQFTKLILEPCSDIEQEKWKNLPNLIVIDGLDGVEIASRRKLLEMIWTALKYRCPFVFLIFSRPEPDICHIFNADAFTSLLAKLEVGYTDASADITAYFRDRFRVLWRKRPYAFQNVPAPWPGEEAIQQLTRRACGQFLFAATVMEFIESWDDLPQARLETILRVRDEQVAESPYPGMDLLYLQILSQCHAWDSILPILRLLLTPQHDPEPLVKADIERLLGLGVTQEANPSVGGWRSPKCIGVLLGLEFDARLVLRGLHSVMKVPSDESMDIQIYHTSFIEFLSDPMRSRQYHVKEFTKAEYFNLLTKASSVEPNPVEVSPSDTSSFPKSEDQEPTITPEKLIQAEETQVNPAPKIHVSLLWREVGIFLLGFSLCWIAVRWRRRMTLDVDAGCSL